MRTKKVPIRLCYECKTKKPCSNYMIWDPLNPKVGTGKRKWYICQECLDKQEKEAS